MTPDQHTIQEAFIEVGDGHTLYAQDWGQPDAKHPIIFLHGGPGASCSNKHKQIFDPEQQRVIFFDQRGCGRSIPAGSIHENTTQHLIADINRVADYFDLKNVVILGGSWGSCLALAYALEHPGRVEALVLRGVFTGSQAEVDHIDKGNFRNFFPEVWERFLAATPKSHHHNPAAYHYQRILGDDEQTRRESAMAYNNLESALLRLDDRFTPIDPTEYDPSGTHVYAHYITNQLFMADRHILKNAHKLTLPVFIIQGRYDFVCPPITARQLHQALPNSQLAMTIAGHSGNDRSTSDVTRSILLQITGA